MTTTVFPNAYTTPLESTATALAIPVMHIYDRMLT